jgi:sporulation protein YlmC with PRC-barrel domain
MRKQLLRAMALGTACCVITAQAQQSGSSAGSQSSRPQDRSQGSPAQDYPSGAAQPQSGQGITSGQSSTGLSATGRMGQQQHVRASQLEGAQVNSSSGQQLGTIKDAIINPTSGRVDFGILSLSSTASTPGTTPGTTTTTPGSSSLTGSGKQVAVPWMLLRSSPGASSPTSTTPGAGATSDKVTFVFSGDATKLHNAPAFNESTDLSQPTWRQSVYSHYGLTSGSATGGSYSPGGRATGGSTDPSSAKDPSSGTSPERDSSSDSSNR